MKLLLLTLSVFLSTLANAQIFTIKPKYHCTIFHKYGKPPETYINDVDTTFQGEFKVDLDKKIISGWGINETPIFDAVYDKENYKYTISLKDGKRVSDEKYFMQMHADGTVLSLVRAWRPSARDTFYDAYTDYAKTLFFYKKSAGVKQALNLNAEISTGTILDLAKSSFKPGENTVEMRDGFVYWTEGSGTNAVKRVLFVDWAYLTSNTHTKGIAVKCHDPDDEHIRYEVYEGKTDGLPDGNLQEMDQKLYILKYTNDVRTGITIIKTY